MEIVILEDSQIIGERLIGRLRSENLAQSVQQLHTIAEARTFFAYRQSDLIILDHHLPDGFAIDLYMGDPPFPRARKVILFTNYLSPAISLHYEKYGILDCFDKAHQLEDLIDSVRAFHQSEREETEDSY